MTVICDNNFHPAVTGRRYSCQPCILRMEDRTFVAAFPRLVVWHRAV